MINKRDIMMLLSGVLGGVSITGIACYIYIDRKYATIRDIQSEIDRLEQEKHELCNQIDYIGDSLDKLKDDYNDRADKYEQEITFYEDELRDAKANAENAGLNVNYQSYSQKQPPADPWEIQDDRPIESSDIPEEQHEEKQMTNYWTDDGHYVIVDSGPRMNGPLTDDEQREFDDAEGDADMEHTILDGIKRQRFLNTIDEDNAVRQISEEEHEQMPPFFDEEELVYYERDDMLANGRMVVDNIPQIIDPVVLSKFGSQSMTSSPDLVFCRNEFLEIDYQITRSKASYQHAILGLPEEQAYIPVKYNQELAHTMEESRGKGKASR